MKGIIAGLVALTVSVVNGQPGESARLNQHRVTNPASPIPSLIDGGADRSRQ